MKKTAYGSAFWQDTLAGGRELSTRTDNLLYIPYLPLSFPWIFSLLMAANLPALTPTLPNAVSATPCDTLLQAGEQR
jgi:hypothetical protein